MASRGQQDGEAVPTILSAMARDTQQQWCLVGKCSPSHRFHCLAGWTMDEMGSRLAR